MRRVTDGPTREEFEGENGDLLEVYRDNRGEPYRAGLTLYLHDRSFSPRLTQGVFIDDTEARRLRDLLNRAFPS